MSNSIKQDEKDQELPQYANGGAVLGGALGGAGAGASVGTAIFPGIGTAIGAVGGALIGGIAGLFSGPAPVFSEDQVQQATNDVQNSYTSQQQLAQAIANQGGLANQQSVYGQQQALANQLGVMAQGGGPNPALSQLNNTTGQNVANQAALMAGQRGAGANAGLIARQAAQQGAATQQQAIGQGAVLRQNQQLSAINALQNQQNMLGGLANTEVSQQLAAQQAANQLALSQEQNVLAGNGQNIQQNQYSTNTGLQLLGAGLNAAGSAGVFNSLSSSAGNTSSLSGLGGSGSGYSLGVLPTTNSSGNIFGVNTKFAEGGQVGSQQQGSQAMLKENYSGPKSRLGRRLKGYAEGGQVEALVSPGEVYLDKDKADKVMAGEASPLDGETIPGKPKVGGAKNSYANDTVKKTLEKGGIVLPRSVTKSADPSESAKRFIDALKAKKGK